MYDIFEIEKEHGTKLKIATITTVDTAKSICEMLNNDSTASFEYTWEKSDEQADAT